MTKKKVLLAGESWVSTATHIKGFDQFPTVTYHTGADELLSALKESPFEVTFMPAHEAQRDFPLTLEGLQAYDAIVLSDIGANTLLLHPDTWIHSRRTPNRLKLLKEYVAGGGALLMFGGYYSFQGINGGARYRNTPVEEVLPVSCLPVDDRVEVPEGFSPVVSGDANHPILSGISGAFPYLLGFNEVVLKEGAQQLMTVSSEYGSLPLLVTGTYGEGRTVVWTSDVGPHWLPPEFIAWPGYKTLFAQMLAWATD
ncbi:glutamine amidotransferase [Rhizobium straminoryzae]|uniref:Cytoplasmic protein n=1 Tax=Rhizobium straminoryzae TaxID=1387186 RepID=A0A549SSC7_9HYPH|nr:glutamine amidotransferase [Rhizobium straminoryzae]TRL32526.1 cytoplasmic protein [Rhizobium straminoryzae]